MWGRSGTHRREALNAGCALQGAPEGRRRAGALFGETTRYLLVYEEGSVGDVTEAEVRAKPIALHCPTACCCSVLGDVLPAQEQLYGRRSVLTGEACPVHADRTLT